MGKAKPARALSEVLKNFRRKPATICYPYVKTKIADKFRGKIVFEPEKCVGCRLCIKDCPAKAIDIIPIEPETFSFTYNSILTGQKAKISIPKFAKRTFICTIDLSRCIYCAQCVDSCPRKALYSTQEFELADLTKDQLTMVYAPGKEATRKGSK